MAITHLIRRPWSGVKAGDRVDVTGWRNADRLEKLGYIRLLTPEELREPASETPVDARPDTPAPVPPPAPAPEPSAPPEPPVTTAPPPAPAPAPSLRAVARRFNPEATDVGRPKAPAKGTRGKAATTPAAPAPSGATATSAAPATETSPTAPDAPTGSLPRRTLPE